MWDFTRFQPCLLSSAHKKTFLQGFDSFLAHLWRHLNKEVRFNLFYTKNKRRKTLKSSLRGVKIYFFPFHNLLTQPNLTDRASITKKMITKYSFKLDNEFNLHMVRWDSNQVFFSKRAQKNIYAWFLNNLNQKRKWVFWCSWKI